MFRSRSPPSLFSAAAACILLIAFSSSASAGVANFGGLGSAFTDAKSATVQPAPAAAVLPSDKFGGSLQLVDAVVVRSTGAPSYMLLGLVFASTGLSAHARTSGGVNEVQGVGLSC